MLAYIIRRILMLIPILLLVSFIAFFVIELPPGDLGDDVCLAAPHVGHRAIGPGG